MAQTLTVLPALTTPVTLIQSETLVANMSAMDNLGPAGIKTIEIIALIHALAVAGTDYRANHRQLIQDTKVLFGGINMVGANGQEDKNRTLIESSLAWSAGFTADATLSRDVNTLINEGRDFLELPEETLNRIIFLLEYKLAI